MSTEALWSVIRAQAAAWAATPVLAAFARELPRNATQRSKGLPGLLQEAQAGAASICAHPLRLATYLPLALSVMPLREEQEIQNHRAWFEASKRVEAAHRLTIAWLRARLPGYPNLHAPQLAPGTPLTTTEFTYRLIWAPGERAQRLQFQNPPPEVADALRADKDQRRAIDATSRAVAAAIVRTPEWLRFIQANAGLDSQSTEELRQTRKRIRDRLSPNEVDSYEPSRGLPRNEYRSTVMAEELAALSGAAAEYATTFDAVDRLIETAASDVFGQLACYPVASWPCNKLEITPGEQTVVSFTLEDDSPMWPGLGMVAWLDDPLVIDAVQVMGVSYHWDRTGRTTHDVTAMVLRQTAVAWREIGKASVSDHEEK